MTSLALAVAFYAFPPPVGDAYRLPPLSVISSGRVFNQRYQSDLKKRLEWDYQNRGRICNMLKEAQKLYEIWDAAEGAHPDWRCVHLEDKMAYIRQLRLLIGPDAYRRMELPPCVPVWRFSQLR